MFRYFASVKKIFAILSSLHDHPLSLGYFSNLNRFLRWQISSRLVDGRFVFKWVDEARLIMGAGSTGVTGNYYSGLMDFHEMSFLLHFLRERDLFVDVGANAGVYTVLASKCCSASSIAFEPIEETYERLLDHININQLALKVDAHQCAVGEEAGAVNVTNNFDTMNHISDRGGQNTVRVDLVKLDDYTHRSEVQDCEHCLMKIDVEGFEKNVISGGETFLRSNVDALIIELNGSGEKYGTDDQDLHEQLLAFGFQPILYDPMQRSLNKTDFDKNNQACKNMIYVKNIETASKRCQEAPSFKIHISKQTTL